MTRTGNDTPPACTLTGDDQISRRDRWLRLAELALVTKTATEAGVELLYRSEPTVLAELTELARLETECCGFARWRVSEAADGVRLEVSTEQTKAPAVWAMFDEGPPGTGAAEACG